MHRQKVIDANQSHLCFVVSFQLYFFFAKEKLNLITFLLIKVKFFFLSHDLFCWLGRKLFLISSHTYWDSFTTNIIDIGRCFFLLHIDTQSNVALIIRKKIKKIREEKNKLYYYLSKSFLKHTFTDAMRYW